MKKWLYFLGITLSCILFTISTHADVLFEPEDSFYQERRSECTYVSRQFTANGPEGKVIVYESPESSKVVDTWENGHQATVAYTYEDKDGTVWGVCESGGWMPMEYMEVIYDNISFMEEHAADIKAQQGTLDKQEGEKIIFWKYPGSEDSYEAEAWDTPLGYENVYEDSEGHSWGYVGYYYGYKEVWVCIDQPTADFQQLYPNGAPQGNAADKAETEGSQVSKTDGNNQDIKDTENPDSSSQEGRIEPKKDYGTMILAAVLVGGVVLVTVLLLVLWKKRIRGL
ncbi:MAG: hypothetical protein HFH39_11390 [Lachnospiraceae bacterium]|nr:hypothetical protein [Lachnospiraceae bacterium]